MSEKTIQTSDTIGPDAFRNMFAILHNLDIRDMAGIDSDANPWRLDRITSFILKLDDARLDALYALVQGCQPERYRDTVREVV